MMSGGKRLTQCSTTRPRQPAAQQEAQRWRRRRFPSSRKSSRKRLRRRRSRAPAMRLPSPPQRLPPPPSCSVTSASDSPRHRRRRSPAAARRSDTRRRRRRPERGPPGCTPWLSRKPASARSVSARSQQHVIIRITSGQRILTKCRIAGADFWRAGMQCDTDRWRALQSAAAVPRSCRYWGFCCSFCCIYYRKDTRCFPTRWTTPKIAPFYWGI